VLTADGSRKSVLPEVVEATRRRFTATERCHLRVPQKHRIREVIAAVPLSGVV
jgi:hypothetical protein